MTTARLTGVALLATTLGLFVAFSYSDPGVESRHDRAAFIQEVTDAAGRMPAIGAAHVVQGLLAVMAIAAGVGLYLLVRRRAPGLGLAGLLTLLLWGTFSALQAMVGAAMVTTAQSYVDGGLAEAGNDQTLLLIDALGRIHFGTFVATGTLLGLAVLSFARGLSWPAGLAPRWLGWLGLLAGGLSALLPLALWQELFFLPWFLGTVLTAVWLLVTGFRLAITRAPGSTAAQATSSKPVSRGAGPPHWPPT